MFQSGDSWQADMDVLLLLPAGGYSVCSVQQQKQQAEHDQQQEKQQDLFYMEWMRGQNQARVLHSSNAS